MSTSVSRQTYITGALLSLLLSFAPDYLQAAQAITAQGIGASCADALRQAKSLAIEQVAGSFVNSQRTLRNDSTIEESLSEYTAGVVTKFNVLESDGASPCKVTIQAELDINRTLVTAAPVTDKGIDLGHVGSLIENRSAGTAIMKSLVDRPDQFRVDISKVTFTQKTNATQIDAQIERISYTEQWANDLQALLSVQTKPRIYEKPSLAKALLTLVTLPITLPITMITAPFTSKSQADTPQNPEGSLCFKQAENFSQLNCYEGPLAFELTTQLSDMSIRPVLKDDAGNPHHLPNKKQISLISTYFSPVPLQGQNSNERRQKFLVISPAGLPFKESIHISERLMTPWFTLGFNVTGGARR